MSGAPFVLRRATSEDAAGIASLIVTAFGEYRGWLLPEPGALRETAASVAADLARTGHGAFAAFDGLALVGCVLFKPEEGDLYFGRLSVAPSARRRGLAEELVGAVESEARAQGYPGVRLGVRIPLEANQRLFTRLGYAEISREAHVGFAEPTWITMRKVL